MQNQTLIEAWDNSTHLLADRLLVQDWPHDLPWQVVAPEYLAQEAHLLPVVLQLDDLEPAHRKEVQQQLTTDDPSKVAPAMLIRSDLGAGALARQLARHVTVTLADGSQALLRLADPEVFIHLLWVLPLPYLASLCEAKWRWSVPFMGEWLELQFDDRPEPVWDALSEEASIALVNVGLINDVLATLPEPRDIKEFWRTGQQCNQWLCTAQTRFGLTDAADCVAFARHGVLLGDRFTRHPVLAPLLETAREIPGAYAQQTAPISQREWNRVIADIEQSSQKRNAS